MFKRIVVGWDGTDAAEAALRWAVARGDGVPITVVHVIPGTTTSSEYLRASGELSAERVRLMEAADESRTRHPELRITTATVHGTALHELAEYAEPGTLLVVGGARHRRGSRWTLGARLAGRDGSGAIAVIPPTPGDTPRSGIVVGTDGSGVSMRAVELAVGEAKRTGEPLEIVHTWVVPPDWESAYDEAVGDVQVLEDMHRGILDESVEYARGLGAQATGRLEHGTAADVLESIAAGASLLVLGAHSGGAVTRFLLGSASHSVLLSLTAPTIVVRAG